MVDEVNVVPSWKSSRYTWEIRPPYTFDMRRVLYRLQVARTRHDEGTANVDGRCRVRHECMYGVK
jgi:hypothetical protein